MVEKEQSDNSTDELINNTTSSVSSWFSSLQKSTTEAINSIKTSSIAQDYSKLAEENTQKYKEKLTEVVNSSKSLVDTNKINGYLDDLDKELEVVENYTINTFSKIGKFISGEQDPNAKSDHTDEVIDEESANLMFNVGKDQKNESDDVVIINKELSDIVNSLKNELLNLKTELTKNEKLNEEYKKFTDLIKDLNFDELKLREYFESSKELTNDEFIKLLSFNKKRSAQPSKSSEKKNDDEDDEDDDWE